MISDVTAYAATAPTVTGSIAGRLCVISRQKTIAVSGTPSDPESIAPMPTAAHSDCCIAVA